MEDEDGKVSNTLMRNVSVSGAARVFTDVKPGTIKCETNECSTSLIPGRIPDKLHRVVVVEPGQEVVEVVEGATGQNVGIRI